jgi:hypothetical protein
MAIGVAVKPGQMAFTRIPSGAQSIAIARVKEVTAPFDAE